MSVSTFPWWSLSPFFHSWFVEIRNQTQSTYCIWLMCLFNLLIYRFPLPLFFPLVIYLLKKPIHLFCRFSQSRFSDWIPHDVIYHFSFPVFPINSITSIMEFDQIKVQFGGKNTSQVVSYASIMRHMFRFLSFVLLVAVAEICCFLGKAPYFNLVSNSWENLLPLIMDFSFSKLGF